MLLSRTTRMGGLQLVKTGITLCLILLLFTGPATLLPPSAVALCADIFPTALIPDFEVYPGVVMDGDPGVASNGTELYELINGGSSVYIAHGFVAGALQNMLVELDLGSTWGTMLITNQGTVANAEALFNDPEIVSGDPVADWPFEGEARLHVFFTTKLQLFHECFYFSIEIGSSEPDAYDAAYCLASYMIGMIETVPAGSRSWSLIKNIY